MTTAISYTSESSDHYLSLYKNKTIIQIINCEMAKFGFEFGYLYIQNIESDELDTKKLCAELQIALEEYCDHDFQDAYENGESMCTFCGECDDD